MLYRFSDCPLDVTQREFVRAGKPAHLTPKAFDLLTALIAQRPRVVGKDELIGLVWPDAFVADVNPTVLMAEFRAAIGDPARSPRLIRTVHRHGYAFIGDVTEEARRPRVPLAGPTAVLRVGARRIILDQGESSVGRDPGCNVVINDVSISRKHAVITVHKGKAHVADESKNGTRVGGRHVKAPTPLASGDVVIFGTIETAFTIEAPEGASTLTVESMDD